MKDLAKDIEELKSRLMILEAEFQQQKEKDPKALAKIKKIGKRIAAQWPKGLTAQQAISQDRGGK